MHKIAAVFLSLLLSFGIAHASPIDINTADAKALATAMKGVGEKRAEAIIAYRTQHGPFKSVDELRKVDGISARIVEDNRQRVTVGKQ